MKSQIDTLIFFFCKFFRRLTPFFIGFSINLNFLYLIIFYILTTLKYNYFII